MAKSGIQNDILMLPEVSGTPATQASVGQFYFVSDAGYLLNGSGNEFGIDQSLLTTDDVDFQSVKLTMPDGGNANPVWIVQGDITNNLTALYVQNQAGGDGLVLESTGGGRGLNIDSNATSNDCAIIQCDSLTTGHGLLIDSDSGDTGARNLLEVINDNSTATNAIGISVSQDSTATGIFLDKNDAGVGMSIDADANAAGALTGISVDAVNAGAGDAFAISSTTGKNVYQHTFVDETGLVPFSWAALTVTPTANSAGTHVSRISTCTHNSAFDLTDANAGLLGSFNNATNSGAGTVTSCAGCFGGVSAQAGTMTNGYCLVGSSEVDGGTLTTGIGLGIEHQLISGTLTNAIGIELRNHTGSPTNTYFMKLAASSDWLSANGNLVVDNNGSPNYIILSTTDATGLNSLDDAYNAGRQITADAGAVEITVPDTSNNVGFIINQNDTTNNPNVSNIVNAGTGDGLFIDQDGNGRAIDIDSEATSTQSINIDAVNTSGSVLRVVNAGNQATGVVVNFTQDNASSVANILNVNNDGSGIGVNIQQNNATATGPGLNIDTQGSGGGDSIVVNTDELVMDDQGHLLVGTNTAGISLGAATVFPAVQVESDSPTLGGYGGVRATNLAGLGGFFAGFYSRGTLGTKVIVQNGDNCAAFIGGGYDGGAYEICSRIDLDIDDAGTPGGTSMPGMINFLTTSDGATIPTERMRIDKDGLVTLNSSAAGVDDILDEDTMSSDSDTAIATQQSIKAYVDSTAGGLSSVLSTELAQKVFTNSTAENTLYSQSVPANTLGTDNGIRVRIYWSAIDSNGGSGTVTVRLKYGSTTVATSTISLTNAITAGVGFIDAQLFANGATNSQKGIVLMDGRQQGGLGTGDLDIIQGIGVGTSAEDSTGALTLSVTIQMSDSGSDFTSEVAIGEILRT